MTPTSKVSSILKKLVEENQAEYNEYQAKLKKVGPAHNDASKLTKRLQLRCSTDEYEYGYAN